MAAINSHRRRVIYDNPNNAYNHAYHNVGNHIKAQSGAFTMMPCKIMNADSYYATKREFGEAYMIGRRGYMNAIVTRNANIGISRSNPYALVETLELKPAGFGNRIRTPYGIVLYDADHYDSSVRRYYSYNRSNNGITTGGYTAQKKVTKVVNGVKQQRYVNVIEVGRHLGGNIQSRASIVKWTAGMWRAK